MFVKISISSSSVKTQKPVHFHSVEGKLTVVMDKSHSFWEFSCLNKYHERLSLRDAIQCCPVCRFVCSCRACLRKMANPKLILEQNPEENQVFAKHILKCCGPSIRELISQFDEEVWIRSASYPSELLPRSIVRGNQ